VAKHTNVIKQLLKNMPMTIQFGTSGWSAVSGDEFTLPSHLNGHAADERGRPDYVTPLGFNDIGELINESEIVINGKGSAGLSIKGHHPEKDGVPTCLLAKEALTARGASLTGQSSQQGGFSSSHLRGIGIS
jgi:Phosphoglucomutase/phosphomannomutase, alpha/beta/alpha domain III